MKKLKCAGIIFVCAISLFLGCSWFKLNIKYEPLTQNIPPEAMKIVNPFDVKIIEGRPLDGREYIRLGIISIDESKSSPVFTESITDERIKDLVRKEAAKHGADAVIEFKITGQHPERKVRGVVIVYRRY